MLKSRWRLPTPAGAGASEHSGTFKKKARRPCRARWSRVIYQMRGDDWVRAGADNFPAPFAIIMKLASSPTFETGSIASFNAHQICEP